MVRYALQKDKISVLTALARCLLGMKYSKEVIQIFKNPFLQKLFGKLQYFSISHNSKTHHLKIPRHMSNLTSLTFSGTQI